MIQAGNLDPHKKNKRASRKEEAKVRYNLYVLLLIDPTEKSVQTAVATTRATRVCLCTDDTEGGRDGAGAGLSVRAPLQHAAPQSGCLQVDLGPREACTANPRATQKNGERKA